MNLKNGCANCSKEQPGDPERITQPFCKSVDAYGQVGANPEVTQIKPTFSRFDLGATLKIKATIVCFLV